jgi:hypothetical protein
VKKFWWSGEIEGDAFDPYREAMKEIEGTLSPLLEGISFGPRIEQWAFIAIIRSEDHPDYDEVVKKSSRGKVLEFRIKIPYGDFVSASRNGQRLLALQALSRSVRLMGNLGVSAQTQALLQDVLSRAEQKVVQQSSQSQSRVQQ